MTPRITVGLPVYKGADLIAKTLDGLQRQTFGDFEAIISVDGGDAETADACRPFLSDSRFRMIVQTDGWTGSAISTGFCSRICKSFSATDSMTTPRPRSFSRFSYGPRTRSRALPLSTATVSILAKPIILRSPARSRVRLLSDASIYRTSARNSGARSYSKPAIQQAGLIRTDEFRAASELFVWLAKLVRWGTFRRVAEPLYNKLERAHNYTNQWRGWSDDKRRAAWTTMFTGLLEAAIPLCRTPEQRLFFQQLILERIAIYPSYLYRSKEPNSSEKLISECVQRLRYECNTQFLNVEEIPIVKQRAKAKLGDINLLERSRMCRAIYQMHQRVRLGRLLYPTRPLRRSIFHINEIFEMLRYEISMLLYRPVIMTRD